MLQSEAKVVITQGPAAWTSCRCHQQATPSLSLSLLHTRTLSLIHTTACSLALLQYRRPYFLSHATLLPVSETIFLESSN